MTFIDNIDWLQIAFDSSFRTDVPEIRFIKKDTVMPMYNCVEEIVLQNGSSEDGVIGTLMSEPRKDMKFLGERHHSFKFKNRVLYIDNNGEKFYITLLKLLQKALNFVSYHIVRLDICRDFEKFKYGLFPETFIRNFINDKYYLEGKKGRVQKRLSGSKLYYEDKVLQEELREIYKTVRSKKFGYEYEVIMNEIEGKNRLNTLTIGTRQNTIQRQLYNKTIEQQKEEKPYITESHDAVNPDRDNREIWRLEFRLKGAQITVLDRQLIDTDTGEVHSFDTLLQLEDIAEQSKITAMINYLIDNKFTYRVSATTVTKTRDWKRLELFDKTVLDNKLPLGRIAIKSTSTRANKIFAKALALNDLVMRSNDQFEKEFTNIYGKEGLDIFKSGRKMQQEYYINEFGLEKYNEEKIIPARSNWVRDERYRKKGN